MKAIALFACSVFACIATSLFFCGGSHTDRLPARYALTLADNYGRRDDMLCNDILTTDTALTVVVDTCGTTVGVATCTIVSVRRCK